MDYKKLRDTRNSSNPFAQRLGIFVEEIGPGYARAVKDITAEDANPVGVAHGGCYFSLADTACGAAMASHGYYAEMCIRDSLRVERFPAKRFRRS